MDYLSRCYRARVRPYRDSPAEVLIRWYFCKPGAKVFPGQHLFGSQVWREVADEPPDQAGELYGPKPYDPGYNPGYVGLCHVGPDDWYSSGVPVSAVTGAPPVLPGCCFVLPPSFAGERGGWRGFSIGRPPPAWGTLGAFSASVEGGTTSQWGGRSGWGGASSTPAVGLWGGRSGLAGLVLSPWGGLSGFTGSDLRSASPWGDLTGWRGTSVTATVGRWGSLGSFKDNGMALLYCSMRLTTAGVLVPPAGLLLPWDTVEDNPAGMWASGQPTRITVPNDGVYAIAHSFGWGAGISAGVTVAADLYKNGAALQPLWQSNTVYTIDVRSAGMLLKLTAGDYLEIKASHDSGGSWGMLGGAFSSPMFRVAALQTEQPAGLLIGVQRFSTPGAYTYTPTAGTKSVIVELQGAGGGGGGAPSPGGTQTAAGGGGGGGSWLRKRLTAGFSGATGSVGSGGLAGTNAGGGGGTGGSTTFITSGGGPVTYAATGGAGGGGGFSQPQNASIIGGAGVAVSGGDDNAPGGPGECGLTHTNFQVAVGGAGGSARYGGGAGPNGVASNNTSTAGATPGGFGGGGSGAAGHGSGAARTGGAGAGGCVVIWEYS